MRWSDVMRPATPKMLRQFAGLWLVCFGLSACWQGLLLGRTLEGALFAAAAVIGLPGLFFPDAIRPVYKIALIMAFPIGWLIAHLILTAIFILLFTPLAIVFRILGRDVLALKKPADKETFWMKKPASEVKRYFFQY